MGENNSRKKNSPVRFQITLNQEQKEAKALILENVITVLQGKAGSGKTLLACQIALDLFYRKEIKRIIITRPTVSKEEIGFLPGTADEKMAPWLAPIYANMYQVHLKDKVDELIHQGVIEIVPVAFMRGRTFTDAVVIVDECQNITGEQTEMIVTRVGTNSKMIICGDISQVDLKKKSDSGFAFLSSLKGRIKGLEVIELKTNHRHPIVDLLLEVYNEKQNG
jgi:phosphate starvation-inducible protein PhoH and related proteins